MVIQSKKVWLADQFVPAAIEVNDGRITAILPYGTKDVDDDYGDKRIVPGFMDIHCHGAYEFDTNDANEDGLRYWAEHIVSEGVTSFLATTITQSVEVLTNAVTNVANVMESGYDGAEILGIHFEGPYLEDVYKRQIFDHASMWKRVSKNIVPLKSRSTACIINTPFQVFSKAPGKLSLIHI